jgi:hypothetical protein
VNRVLRRTALGGQPRDARLDDRAHLEPEQDGVEPEVGDAEAAVGVEVDEALAAQAAERLADRRARDAEALRQVDLPEPRTRRDVAAQYERPEALVRDIDDGRRRRDHPRIISRPPRASTRSSCRSRWSP